MPMSRIVLKEPEEEFPRDLPPLTVSKHPNYITPTGHARLLAQLAVTERHLAEALPNQIDSQLIRTALALDIRRLQARLETAIPVETHAQIAGQIGFGAFALARDTTGHEHRYQIVGEDEAEPRVGRISWCSPLGKALMGARVGDFVLWERPAGELELEILSIRPG